MPLPEGAKILVVDDVASMRVALRHALSRLGFTDVLECGDGTQALAALKNTTVDLVISDWQMEPMDGLGLLEAVRGDAELSGLPFILVSGEAGTHLHERAAAAGASIVLNKPFGTDILRAAIAGLAPPSFRQTDP